MDVGKYFQTLKVKVAERIFLSPPTPCSASGIVVAFYIHSIQYTCISEMLFKQCKHAKQRYMSGVYQSRGKDMKIVNLKMSLITAGPPLCYGHFSARVPPHWIKVFLAISALEIHSQPLD